MRRQKTEFEQLSLPDITPFPKSLVSYRTRASDAPPTDRTERKVSDMNFVKQESRQVDGYVTQRDGIISAWTNTDHGGHRCVLEINADDLKEGADPKVVLSAILEVWGGMHGQVAEAVQLLYANLNAIDSHEDCLRKITALIDTTLHKHASLPYSRHLDRQTIFAILYTVFSKLVRGVEIKQSDLSMLCDPPLEPIPPYDPAARQEASVTLTIDSVGQTLPQSSEEVETSHAGGLQARLSAINEKPSSSSAAAGYDDYSENLMDEDDDEDDANSPPGTASKRPRLDDESSTSGSCAPSTVDSLFPNPGPSRLRSVARLSPLTPIAEDAEDSTATLHNSTRASARIANKPSSKGKSNADAAPGEGKKEIDKITKSLWRVMPSMSELLKRPIHPDRNLVDMLQAAIVGTVTGLYVKDSTTVAKRHFESMKCRVYYTQEHFPSHETLSTVKFDKLDNMRLFVFGTTDRLTHSQQLQVPFSTGTLKIDISPFRKDPKEDNDGAGEGLSEMDVGGVEGSREMSVGGAEDSREMSVGGVDDSGEMGVGGVEDSSGDENTENDEETDLEKYIRDVDLLAQYRQLSCAGISLPEISIRLFDPALHPATSTAVLDYIKVLRIKFDSPKQLFLNIYYSERKQLPPSTNFPVFVGSIINGVTDATHAGRRVGVDSLLEASTFDEYPQYAFISSSPFSVSVSYPPIDPEVSAYAHPKLSGIGLARFAEQEVADQDGKVVAARRKKIAAGESPDARRFNQLSPTKTTPVAVKINADLVDAGITEGREFTEKIRLHVVESRESADSMDESLSDKLKEIMVGVGCSAKMAKGKFDLPDQTTVLTVSKGGSDSLITFHHDIMHDNEPLLDINASKINPALAPKGNQFAPGCEPGSGFNGVAAGGFWMNDIYVEQHNVWGDVGKTYDDYLASLLRDGYTIKQSTAIGPGLYDMLLYDSWNQTLVSVVLQLAQRNDNLLSLGSMGDEIFLNRIEKSDSSFFTFMRLSGLADIGAAIVSQDLLATRKRSSAMLDQLNALIPWKRSARKTMSPELRIKIAQADDYILKNANEGYPAFPPPFLSYFDHLVAQRILGEASPGYVEAVKGFLGKDFDFTSDVFTGLDGKGITVAQSVYFFQHLQFGATMNPELVASLIKKFVDAEGRCSRTGVKLIPHQRAGPYQASVSHILSKAESIAVGECETERAKLDSFRFDSAFSNALCTDFHSDDIPPTLDYISYHSHLASFFVRLTHGKFSNDNFRPIGLPLPPSINTVPDASEFLHNSSKDLSTAPPTADPTLLFASQKTLCSNSYRGGKALMDQDRDEEIAVMEEAEKIAEEGRKEEKAKLELEMKRQAELEMVEQETVKPQRRVASAAELASIKALNARRSEKIAKKAATTAIIKATKAKNKEEARKKKEEAAETEEASG